MVVCNVSTVLIIVFNLLFKSAWFEPIFSIKTPESFFISLFISSVLLYSNEWLSAIVVPRFSITNFISEFIASIFSKV